MDCDSKLESLYQSWQKLRTTSSNQDFDDFGSFFNESCIGWLKSMREWDQPSIGRQAIIDEVKANTEIYHIEERRVLSSLISKDGRTVSCEMKNRMNILGNPLDPFYETVVVRFNDEGLITEFKTYSCRSPIVAVIQAMTGEGPYTLETVKEEFE